MKTTKYSRQRETLLRVLCATKSHPSADAIYGEVRKEIPNISLGTVYRNLARLAEDGVIMKLDVGDGTEHYDGNTVLHSHFACEKCGRIEDVCEGDSIAESVKRSAEEITGGRIRTYSLVYLGTCRDCLKKESENDNDSDRNAD